MDKQRIRVSNTEDRQLIAGILIKNGYTVRLVRDKVGNKAEQFVEYWREVNAG